MRHITANDRKTLGVAIEDVLSDHADAYNRRSARCSTKYLVLGELYLKTPARAVFISKGAAKSRLKNISLYDYGTTLRKSALDKIRDRQNSNHLETTIYDKGSQTLVGRSVWSFSRALDIGVLGRITAVRRRCLRHFECKPARLIVPSELAVGHARIAVQLGSEFTNVCAEYYASRGACKFEETADKSC